MRNDQDRALVAEKCILKNLSGLDVEVIRGFVEDQQVCVGQKDFQQSQPGLLAPGEDRNFLVDVVPGEEEGAQQIPPLLVVAPRPGGVDLIPDRSPIIQVLCALLREKSHLHVQSRGDFAGRLRFDAAEDP